MNFHYAAYSYLDDYLAVDSPCIEAFASAHGDQGKAREQLAIFATRYGVARNFRLKAFEEAERLSFVCDELQKAVRPDNDEQLVTAVDAFLNVLQGKYNKKPLSAVTKFLWIRFQHPVVIYDSLTWAWVKRHSDLRDDSTYANFVCEWRGWFRGCERKVREASRDLVAIKRFTMAEKMGAIELTKLVENDWFVERVFDHAIMADDLEHRANAKAVDSLRE